MLAICPKAVGSPLMGAPLPTTKASPEARVSIPSVAMKGGTLISEMTAPLILPAISPTSTATRTESQIWSGKDLANRAPDIALTAMTLPTDKSMPPVRMTSVCPRAIRAKGAAAMRIVVTLSTVPNRALR